MTLIAAAKSFEELLTPGAAPAPYEYQTLFEAKGWLDRRRAKRRFKLLKKLDPKLLAVLKPGERVFFVTSGTTTSFAEQFFVGWVAYYLNRRALVFTTERVLLVQIDSRKRPLHLVSQLRYDQIAAVKSTWNGICEVKLQGGMKLKFQGVPSAERKFLNKFLKDIVNPSAAGATRPANHIEHLCPVCFVVVPGRPLSCPACGAAFKSAKKAGLLSLAFPGLGDFYLGHKGFAAMETFWALLVWSAFVVTPIVTGGVTDADTGEVLPVDAGYWLGVAIFIGLMHGIDATMTHHFAQKGHHPAQFVSGASRGPACAARFD